MFEWQELAECRGMDVNAFTLPLTVTQQGQAKAVCARCPVVSDCLAATPGDDVDTIRGGMTPDEREARTRSRTDAVLTGGRV